MRKYLKRPELVKLIATAKDRGRHGARDALILTLMYRHGFRASEVCRLLWSDIDLEERTILCRRLKSGVDSVHPLSPDEVQRLRGHYEQSGGQSLVFPSERGGRMHRQNVNRIVERASVGQQIRVTPHKLRHSTGYALVRARLPIRNVQAFLGHAAISSTLVYAHLDETRFVGATAALA